MLKQLAALTALFLASGPAAADTPRGYLDVYFVPSAKVEVTIPGAGTFDNDGDGFGVKGMAPLSDGVALAGEFQSVSYDNAGDLDQVRAGLAFMGQGGGGLIVEYITADDSLEADGFGAHLRLGGRTFYGQFGYLMLDDDSEDVTGFEVALGFAVDLSGALGVFADVRRSMLEGEDSEVELELTDVRAGLRLKF